MILINLATPDILKRSLWRSCNKRAYQKNKAKKKAASAAWQAANQGRVREYKQRSWERNRSRIKQERRAKREAAYLADPRGMWLLETFRAAQTRAKRRGIRFDDSAPEIDLPDRCPILGIALSWNARRGVHAADSPSLDRIVPERGYVAGNLRVISNRANTLKNNATLEEIRLIMADLERSRGEL